MVRVGTNPQSSRAQGVICCTVKHHLDRTGTLACRETELLLATQQGLAIPQARLASGGNTAQDQARVAFTASQNTVSIAKRNGLRTVVVLSRRKYGRAATSSLKLRFPWRRWIPGAGVEAARRYSSVCRKDEGLCQTSVHCLLRKISSSELLQMDSSHRLWWWGTHSTRVCRWAVTALKLQNGHP